MKTERTAGGGLSGRQVSFAIVLLCSLLGALTDAPLSAQTQSATLAGFVNDPTGAVIPDAQVTLTNLSSRDKRDTKSNGSGYFSFTAVPAGAYEVEVQRTGFKSFVERNIQLHPADQRTLTDINLAIGEVNTVITVDSASAAVNTQGEKSVIITADDIKRLPVEGRDVTELIKTLPGFAQTTQSANIQSGAGANNVGPNSDTVGGQTGNYTANGISAQGVQIVSDGVNITDPGNGAGSDQAINIDNVAEVKIQTSNFGADSAKGPIVINAVGKSGGAVYHGELYVYGRTYQLDTQDWFSKYDHDAKPSDREIYPGGNIGGPVRIPGTDFNHNKKLRFFVSGEDYIQKDNYAYGSSSAATVTALLPTAAMRKGDFSAPSLAAYFGPLAPAGGAPGATSLADCNVNGTLALYINICGVPAGYTPQKDDKGLVQGDPIVNGQLPTQDFDTGTRAILNSLIPLPNTAPFLSNQGGTANGATDDSVFNYKQVNLLDNSSYQTRARVDYDLSDSTKFYVTYDFQHSNSRNPQQIYYSPQSNFGEINTPSGILSQDFSHVASFNLTKVFSPTITNELYGGVNLNLGGNEVGKPGANLSATIGYPYQGIYNTNQYPQLDDYGYNGLPLALYPDYSSPIFQRKFVPNGGDNFTFLIKTHTIKVGIYAERSENNETDLNGASNGQILNYYDGPNSGAGSIYQPNNISYNSPGNYLASFFLGQVQEFQQYNFQTNSDLFYWNVDSFATDSYKVTKKLTLDYGFRLGHLGPWKDSHGVGFAVFDPKLYAQQTSVSNGVVSLTSSNLSPGFTWHGINSAIPNSGAGSTPLFFSPRFGIAYDMYGDGRTIFRGGIGAYRSHDGWNDVNQEQSTAQGQILSTVGGGGIMLRNVQALAQGGFTGSSNQGGTSGIAFGLAQGDTEQPLTYTYSLTVDQQFNPVTLFELSYQGSQSSHLLTQYEQGAVGDLENINALPIGSFFKPNPLTGVVQSPQAISENATIENQYRQYPYYSQVNVARHILYGNYNALQASLKRTQGHVLYSVNYTWSKLLGVVGSYSTGNVVDSTNIRPNYGPLANDRSHVVNATFSLENGSFLHGDHIVRSIFSGYDLSGIINLQSGPNAQRVLNSNFNLQGNVVPPTGVAATNQNDFPINNVNILGTPDIVLQPALTCDPRTGLNKAAHQYINVKCFSLPQYGVNGPAELPYIHAPAYFDFDARLTRSFALPDKHTLQFQLSGFNVINRPNYSFSSKFPSEQTLFYFGNTLATATPPSQFGYAQYRFGRRVTEISIKYSF